METSAYYLGKSEQCRRLAKEILGRNNPAIATLLAMAAAFEAKAIEIAIQESNAFFHNDRRG